jgi:molybdate transport system substrate-binding protein
MSMIRNAGVAWIAGAVWFGASTPAYASYPVAPDVVVFCEPTLQRAVSDVGALWRQQTGVPVRIFTSSTPAMLEQIAHHARDDVIIGEGDGESRAATERHLIKPETLQKLGRNRLVVAARTDGLIAAAQTSPTAAERLAAVAGKATFAIVDPWVAVAGADGKAALQSLGLWQAVESKSVGVTGTADAVFLLAQRKARLAIVYATDVAGNPDLTIAATLPESGYPPITYWGALPAYSLSPNAAKFLAILHEPQAQRRLRAAGLEISP